MLVQKLLVQQYHNQHKVGLYRDKALKLKALNFNTFQLLEIATYSESCSNISATSYLLYCPGCLSLSGFKFYRLPTALDTVDYTAKEGAMQNYVDF